MTNPSFTQVTFRGRNDDGNETGATWKAAQGADWTQLTDTNFRVRFLLDETASRAWTSKTWNLYFQKNGGGYSAAGAGTAIVFSLSGNFADGDDCTSQLTGGSGSFLVDNNGMKEASGGAVNSGAAGNYFEVEFCIQINSAQVANGDTINLRIYDSTAAIAAYTDTPVITANEPALLVVADAYTTSQVDVPAVTKQSTLAVNDSSVVSQVDTPVLTGEWTPYAIDNSNLFWSPGNWYKNGSVYAQTNNQGAYLKVAFTGTGLRLALDMSVFDALAEAAADYPRLSYKIDAGSFSSVLLTSGQITQNIATGLSDSAHTAEIYLKTTGGADTHDRWTTPSRQLRITGVSVSGTGTLSAPTLKTKRWVQFGDSITEGVNVLGDSYSNIDMDAHSVWGLQIAFLQDAEVGIVGFIGQAWDFPGASTGCNVPEFHNTAVQTWDKLFSSQSRNYTGIDAILVNAGANDALGAPPTSDADVEAFVEDFLADFRAAHAGIKIYLIVPFGDLKRAPITEAWHDYQMATPDANCFLVDIIAADATLREDLDGDATWTTYSNDGVHPNQAGHDRIAVLLDPVFDGVFLSVQSASVTTQADALAVSLVKTLVIQDAACTTQVDAPVITKQSTLTVQDASCTTQVDAIILTQVHNLTVQDAACMTQVDAVVLAQAHNLAVQDASVISQVDAPTITKQSTLTVQDASVISQTDNVTLIYSGGAIDLTVHDAFCISTADPITGFPQVLSPVSDLSDGSWTNQDGNNTNLFESVNEGMPSDADFIQSEWNPATSPVVVGLASGSDPLSSSGHILSYRLEKYPDGSETTSVTVQLRQGYVNESSLGILIAEWIDNNLSDAMTTLSRTLTGVQADSITDYAALSVRIVAD